MLISPLIAPGTVYRVPAGSTPLDHTSILKTVEQRWNLPPLTARDAAAPGFGDVLTLAARAPTTSWPASRSRSPAARAPRPARYSHLEAIRQELPANTAPAGRPRRPRHPARPGQDLRPGPLTPKVKGTKPVFRTDR